MKKVLFLLLCSLTLSLCVSAFNYEAMWAAEEKENKNENGFIYRIEDNNAILYGYDGDKTYISLPESIEGCPVTEIRNFYGINKDYAKGSTMKSDLFSEPIYVAPISHIQSITVPKSVTRIANGVFAHLESLTKLAVDAGNPSYYSPNNCIVETATQTVVTGCRGARIPEAVTRIGEKAFASSKIKSVTFPESVTEIYANAFFECADLQSVKLPSTLTSIGEYAFRDCSSLARITIPASVDTIGHGAFNGCTMLNTITVDEANPTFYAEERCILTRAGKRIVAAINNAKLPDDFTVVEAHAFDDCLNKYIEELVLPETLTRIDEYAFARNGFTKIVIPASLTEIAPFAFFNCYSLRTIKVAEGNPRYYSDGGCLIDRETNAVVAACISGVSVPSGIRAIGEGAFQNYSGSTISLPTSVLTIAEGAFRQLNALEVDYDGSPVMWSVLPRYATGLQNAKSDCKGKDADTLAAADFDGDGIIRVRDALLATEATEGKDIDGDGVFTQTDVLWILLLCTAE